MPAIRDSVIVLTGASSGIGRAAALELARRGSTLFLGARRADALAETAEACREAGGEAHVVVTDVTVEADVARLTAAAIARCGRIDVWINNAGVTLYEQIEDGPFEGHKRVIETNLYGAIHGARAVVPIFRRQHRGVLVNVGSVLSQVGQAFVPAYVISKFGVHGLSEALRVELAQERDIHICTLLPYAIDTPHFQVAGNHLGQAPYALPPVQSPEKVARALVKLIEKPRRTLHVPRIAAVGLAFHALFPRLSERLLLAALRRWHLVDEPTPYTAGNLYEPPTEPATTHGDRPPKISTPRFLAWLAGQLVKIEVDAAGHAARRLLGQASS